MLKTSNPFMAGLLLARGTACDIWVAGALGDSRTVRQMLETDSTLANVSNGVRFYPRSAAYPLAIAAHEGHLEVVRLLLDYGADPDARMVTDFPNDAAGTPTGYVESGVPLIFAIEKRHFDIAHLLLDRGARVDSSAIYAGPRIGDVAMASGDRALVDRIYINGGRPLLGTYITTRNYAVIAESLHRDPEHASKEFLGSPNPDIVRMCLRYQPQLTDQESFSLIFNLMRARAFAEQQLGIDGRRDAISLLLDYGVNPNVRWYENVTLLHLIQGCNDVRRNTEEDMTEFARVLLDHGADINAIDDEMQSTPLGWRARYGDTKVVEYLLSRGADPHIAGASWATPLAWAEKKGYPEIAGILRKHGATA